MTILRVVAPGTAQRAGPLMTLRTSAKERDESESDGAALAASLIEPEKFAVLFDRHAASVHRYLARRVAGLADDLLGETFLVAFRSRAGYEPARGEVRQWLFGIATNLLRRHARDEQRRYRALARVVPDEGLEILATDLTIERLDAQALGADLAAALAALKPGDRDVLLLWAWAELSYAQIAHALDIPPGTVRSRLNRARRITRTHVAATWLTEETS